MSLEVYAKSKSEEVNNLGILLALKDYLTIKVNLMVKSFFENNNDKFHGIFDKEVYHEGLRVRKEVYDFLEKEVKSIVKSYNENKEKFEYDYGWYENVSAQIRHKITLDELYYEMCEIIKEIYYVFLEDKFPEKYRVTVAEEFLVRGEIESKFS